MGPYAADLARLRARARGPGDLVRAPASVAHVRALGEAVRTRLGLTLPVAYGSLLAECNGFSVAGVRLLGVDADLTQDACGDAPRGAGACLATNLDHERSRLAARRRERLLVLGWSPGAAWAMKEEGSFWRVDPHSWRETEHFRDGFSLLRTLLRGGE